MVISCHNYPLASYKVTHCTIGDWDPSGAVFLRPPAGCHQFQRCHQRVWEGPPTAQSLWRASKPGSCQGGTDTWPNTGWKRKVRSLKWAFWTGKIGENGVYSQWNSHLIGIMIMKTIGFRGTLFSDKPNWENMWKLMMKCGILRYLIFRQTQTSDV